MNKPPAKSQVSAAMRFYELGCVVKRKTCTGDQIPPFCFLRPGVSPEKATAKSAQALNITVPAGLVTRPRVMRVAAEGRR